VTRDQLELLTIAQVADLWKISKRTLQRRIAAGEIPTVRVAGARRIRADVALELSRGEPTMVGLPTIERS
jgi:excisionase family DNA binding protein